MEQVTGIGGVMFRAPDPGGLADWYRDHLGIATNVWHQQAGPTAWAPFPADTTYFGRADQQVMINFRVQDLDAMVSQLRSAGVPLVDEVQEEPGLGRFVHAVDPAGNRFELWEPVAAGATNTPA